MFVSWLWLRLHLYKHLFGCFEYLSCALQPFEFKKSELLFWARLSVVLLDVRPFKLSALDRLRIAGGCCAKELQSVTITSATYTDVVLQRFKTCIIYTVLAHAGWSEAKVLATALLTRIRLATRSALQSRQWQLIGTSYWYCSALCGHPLPARANSWTRSLQPADIPPPQSATLRLHTVAFKLLTSHPAEGRRLSWPEHAAS